MLELVKILQIASLYWRNHTSDRPLALESPWSFCACAMPPTVPITLSHRGTDIQSKNPDTKNTYYFLKLHFSMYFPSFQSNAEHNKVAKTLPPLE